MLKANKNMTRILTIIAGLLAVIVLLMSAYNREHPGYDGTNYVDTASTDAPHATPKPVAIIRDSDMVKGKEEQFVQDRTSLIAHVDPGDDRSLTITMDGNVWNSWSEQDKELHKVGIYNQWVRAYAKFHAKKWTSSAPFTLRIVDLTGTKLASYY
jgi:hypothetical protein